MKLISDKSNYCGNCNGSGMTCGEACHVCWGKGETDPILNYTFLKPDGSRFSFTDTSYESASKKVHHSDSLVSITK